MKQSEEISIGDNSEEWKRFKRRALGMFRWSTEIRLEEVAQLLYQTGIASSVSRGREIAPGLAGKRVSYGFCKELDFDIVRYGSGSVSFRIRALDTTPMPGGAGL